MRVQEELPGTAHGRPAGGERIRTDASALEWLGQFRKAMDLCTMYPAGHPAVISAASGAHESLQAILAASKRVELLAVEKQLYFNRRLVNDPEGRAADLTERMRRRSIRGIAFHSGTSLEELATCLQILTASPEKLRAERGAAAAGAARGLTRIVLSDLDYARLSLGDDPFQTPAMEQLLGEDLCNFLSGRMQAPTSMVLTEAQHLFERQTPMAATLAAAAEAASRVPGFETPNLQATVIVQVIRGICEVMLQKQGEWTQAKAAFSDALVDMPSPLRSATVLCAAPPAGEGPDFFERILDDLTDEHVAQLLIREAQDVQYAPARLAMLFARLVRSYDRFVRMEERLRDILSEEGLEELFDRVIEPTMLEVFVGNGAEGTGGEADWAPATGTEAEEAIALQLAVTDEGGMVSDWQAIEMLLHVALGAPEAGAVEETLGPLRTALSEAVAGGDLEAVAHTFSLLSREAHRSKRAEELLRALFSHRMVEEVGRAFAESDEAVRAKAGDVLHQLGQQATAPLSSVLRTTDQMDVVRDAAALLVRIGNDAAQAPLVEALAHPDAQRRLATVRGLSLESSPRAQEFLIAALSDPAAQVREAAALGLGRRRYERAVAALGQLAIGRGAAKEDASRTAAVSALGQVGCDEAVRWLAEVLKHRPLLGKKSHEQLQFLAVNALEEAGTEAAMAVLQEMGQAGPRGLRPACQAAVQRRTGAAASTAAPVQT